jgi:hypothetical protein
MILKFSLNIVLLAALTSCATPGYNLLTGTENNVPSQFNLSQTPNSKTGDYGGKIRISFEDHQKLKDEVEVKIANEMLPAKEAAQLRSFVPKGGRFLVQIFRPSVGSASTSVFTYVLKKNGKEIARQEGTKGARSVASVPSHYGPDGYWWTNLEIVHLNEQFKEGDTVELFVIDTISSGRDEFKLTYKMPEAIK